jgi:hypothetical protein
VDGTRRISLAGSNFSSNHVVVRFFLAGFHICHFAFLLSATVRVQTLSGRGCGGGIHIEGGAASFESCVIESNDVVMASNAAIDATGGGICVNDRAEVTATLCTIIGNIAGGSGLYESLPFYRPQSSQLLHNRAAHIDCRGSLTMLQCTAFDAAAPIENGAPTWFAVRGAGALSLIDAQLSSSVKRTTMLTLVEKDSQALLRHCALTNLTIDIAGEWGVKNLGIVDSTFDPPLAETIPTGGVSQTPTGERIPTECALRVAGPEPMCDPRASCTLGTSGGVQCRCSDAGLREKAGSRKDGSVCERMPSLDAQLVTPQIRLVVQKPGNSSSSVVYQLRAEGEMTFTVTHRINTSLIQQVGDETRRLHSVASSGAAGSTAFGSRLAWDDPAPTWEAGFNLDSAKEKFFDVQAHQFRIVLDCNLSSTIQCAADGDSIETIIEASPSLYDDAGRPIATSIRTTSTVHIMVEALASCENTLVHVLPDVLEVLESTPMRIEVLAMDVDGLAIKYTRPEIEVWWVDDSGRPERLGYSRNSGHARAHDRTPARRASMHTRRHAQVPTVSFSRCPSGWCWRVSMMWWSESRMDGTGQ